MNGTAQLIEDEGVLEEPTGGFSHEAMGFVKIREGLAAQRTVSGSTVSGFVTAQRVFRRMSPNEIAQALVSFIDSFMIPNDQRRSALYESMMIALLQKIQGLSSDVIRQYEDVAYQDEESEERIRSARALFGSIAYAVPESPDAYMTGDDAF